MYIFAYVMFVVVSIIFILNMIISIRIEKVSEYRKDIIDRIYNFNDWEWRRDKFREVSYNTMLFKFWKKLDSFYPDKSFMEETIILKDITSIRYISLILNNYKGYSTINDILIRVIHDENSKLLIAELDNTYDDYIYVNGSGYTDDMAIDDLINNIISEYKCYVECDINTLDEQAQTVRNIYETILKKD